MKMRTTKKRLTKPTSNDNDAGEKLSDFDGLLHLLRLLLGDLAEPLPLGAHYLALAITNELLVIILLGDNGPVVFAVILHVHKAVVVHDLPLDLGLVHRGALLELGQQLGLGQLH